MNLLRTGLSTQFKAVELAGIGRKYTDYNKLVSDPKAAPYVAKFMLQTGLQSQFQAVDQTSDEGREG
jgi:hypothetical protein